jgi:hypothetical protein
VGVSATETYDIKDVIMTAPDTAVVTVKAEEDLGFMRGKADEYRSDEDSLADFLAEHVKQSTFATLRHSEMFSRYQAWAKAEGISFAMSSRGLAKRLRERGFHESRASGGWRSWVGIELSAE